MKLFLVSSMSYYAAGLLGFMTTFFGLQKGSVGLDDIKDLAFYVIVPLLLILLFLRFKRKKPRR